MPIDKGHYLHFAEGGTEAQGETWKVPDSRQLMNKGMKNRTLLCLGGTPLKEGTATGTAFPSATCTSDTLCGGRGMFYPQSGSASWVWVFSILQMDILRFRILRAFLCKGKIQSKPITS